MDQHPLLAPLNEAQRAAVAAAPGPVLVLAGAGSGKTRVLTHRAAWLILEHGLAPQGLLAVTFTNKAAAEMRGRIETLLGIPGSALWIGTFHGIAHRLLRRHWREAGLPQTFRIQDEDDQQRLVRRIIREQQLDEQRWPPREVTGFINRQKDEGRRPPQLEDRGDPTRRQLIRIYELYQQRCNQQGLVDFAELLLRAFEVLRDQPQLGAHYRSRFRHLLVDEFQDTNTIQYQWLRLLATDGGAPFVVGDDDQSIYRWRGARVENMQQFRRDFAAQVFRLEQNYRSTAVILGAANAVIAKNRDRMGKELWTAAAGGEPIRVYAAFNERDEAEFVLERIREHQRSGEPLAACAILYRSNAQSRAFEEALMAARIPYRVYGGLRFFERAEIKDALAYLRLTQAPADDTAFERIVNLPVRGIGAATLEQLRAVARQREQSLWDAVETLAPELPARAANALRGFRALIARITAGIAGLELHEQIRLAIEASGLREHYAREKENRGEARLENLEELVSAAEGFAPDDDEGLPPLAAFLAHATLESGEAQASAGLDSVQLMTLHSAKGLEFPTVFIVGLEEGLFPSEQAAADADRLPEERRLCYVGITRAMRRLYLTHAESRRIYGRTGYRDPSRFLAELPQQALTEVRPRISVSRPLATDPGRPIVRPDTRAWAAPAVSPRRSHSARPVPGEDTPMPLGARVRHPKFGEGTILRFEGNGDSRQVHVNFERAGQKWLMFSLARLEQL
ncbi:MAG: DNA helicase II [Gammaproteobacteria bacterium]|nr:MAG: DNA helicase II [Gammaproteobacteria bacterium]